MYVQIEMMLLLSRRRALATPAQPRENEREKGGGGTAKYAIKKKVPTYSDGCGEVRGMT